MPDIYPIEEWRPVKGYEGVYEVSNAGRVRRVVFAQRKEPKIMCLANVLGYRTVGLTKNGKNKLHYVHRLVASEFIGDCPPGFQCNHKNGIKNDNRPENLEWVTAKQNNTHARNVLGTLPIAKPKPAKPPKLAPVVRLTVTISPDSWAWLQTKDNKSRAVDDALTAARLAAPVRGGRM